MDETDKPASDPRFSASRMAHYFIPDYMREGLSMYLTHGVIPGSFLHAVLQNDLREAAACADETNRALLWNYVNYLWNEAPFSCWGSKELVDAWAKRFADEREREASQCAP